MSILTSVIPLWARLLFIAFVIGSVAVIADRHRKGLDDTEKQAELMTQQHGFDVRIKASDDALIAANKRAGTQTQGATDDRVAIDTAYNKGMTDERTNAKTRAADYASGHQRVRVDAICSTNASGDRKLSGTAATASGPDGAAGGYAELSPEAAGRFETAASEIIGSIRQQVIRLQGIAQSDHDRCNAGNTEPNK